MLAIGILIGAALASVTWTGAPADVGVNDGPLVVDVSTAEVDDAHTVQLAVTLTDGTGLRINAAGTVTATTCVPGKALASGEVLGAINGVNVRLLSTSVPLWRDLRSGDKGTDVSAVQAELRELGISAPDTGKVDWATMQAIRGWLAGTDEQAWAAYSHGDTGLALPLAAVVWTQARSVTPLECRLQLGGAVAEGDVAIVPQPQIVRIAPSVAVDALPGTTRVLVLGAVTVPVDDSGVVTDAASLARLTATPEVASFLAAPADSRKLEGVLKLDPPVTVGSVPPAAVVDAATAPCLIDANGKSTAVRVVSSRLGRTLVVAGVPGESLPDRVVVDRNGNRTCASS